MQIVSCLHFFFYYARFCERNIISYKIKGELKDISISAALLYYIYIVSDFTMLPNALNKASSEELVNDVFNYYKGFLRGSSVHKNTFGFYILEVEKFGGFMEQLIFINLFSTFLFKVNFYDLCVGIN